MNERKLLIMILLPLLSRHYMNNNNVLLRIVFDLVVVLILSETMMTTTITTNLGVNGQQQQQQQELQDTPLMGASYWYVWFKISTHCGVVTRTPLSINNTFILPYLCLSFIIYLSILYFQTNTHTTTQTHTHTNWLLFIPYDLYSLYIAHSIYGCIHHVWHDMKWHEMHYSTYSPNYGTYTTSGKQWKEFHLWITIILSYYLFHPA